MSVLYRAGTVYSQADLFATAMLTDRGSVTWVGDEQGAQVRAESAQRVVDLGGALVTPAFVDVGDPSESGEVLASRGVAAVLERAPWAVLVSTTEDLLAVPGGHVAVLDPRALPRDADLAAASSAGVPLAFGTASGQDCDPWRMVAHALARGLSARAGFVAATRGAWRASALGIPGGRLEVGAPATFAVWEPTPLGIQVADVARSAWSVDARAGLPPLPALPDAETEAWASPRATLTVLDGDTLFAC